MALRAFGRRGGLPQNTALHLLWERAPAREWWYGHLRHSASGAASQKHSASSVVGASPCSRMVACTSARLGVLTGKSLASSRIGLASAFAQKTLVALGLALARVGADWRFRGFALFRFFGLFGLIGGRDGREVVSRMASRHYGQPAKSRSRAGERGYPMPCVHGGLPVCFMPFIIGKCSACARGDT